MPPPFDPYHEWLGIPPSEQPPNHYRLLGISLFETSAAVITNAAQRGLLHVRTFAIGNYSEQSQKLLNEIAKAKRCLLNAERKARYDAQLREQLGQVKKRSAGAWVIGSALDCDLVLAEPTVSGRHCRLIETSRGMFLEDLGSTNGTFVNGRRITERTAVSASDDVRLGRNIAFPWPKRAKTRKVRVIRIGAAPDNDVVLNLPMISAHHARITIEGSIAVIEDLQSTNGTALGSPMNRIERAALSTSDIVFFGSHGVLASKLLGRS